MELQYQLSFAERMGYGVGVDKTWRQTARQQVEALVKTLIALGKTLRANT